MEENKIHCMLYSSLKKNAVERAEIIYCDSCDKCSLYKQGKCLRVRKFLSYNECEYGRTDSVQGYSPRAAKYYEFHNKYKQDEVFGKLKEAYGPMIAKIGDYYFVDNKYTTITDYTAEQKNKLQFYGGRWFKKKGLEEYYYLSQSMFSSSGGFVRKEDLEDLSEDGILYYLFHHWPRTIFDGTKIKDYQEKTLPDLCMSFRKLAPDLAAKFFAAYPDFDYKPNYIGKKAFVRSVKDGVVIKHRHGDFVKRGNKLICKHYDDVFAPFDAHDVYMEITLKGEETFEITSEDQVDSDIELVV